MICCFLFLFWSQVFVSLFLETAEYLIDYDDDDEEEDQTMKEILKVMKRNPLLDVSRKSIT